MHRSVNEKLVIDSIIALYYTTLAVAQSSPEKENVSHYFKMVIYFDILKHYLSIKHLYAAPITSTSCKHGGHASTAPMPGGFIFEDFNNLFNIVAIQIHWRFVFYTNRLCGMKTIREEEMQRVV